MGRQTRTPMTILPWNLAAAMNEIEKEDNVTVDIVGKAKGISKFGRNTDVGTAEETLWQLGGNEVYVSTNIIDTVSSSNAGDTGTYRLEGHTVDADGNLTFVVQTVTLAGQVKVPLTTPLARASRFNNATNVNTLGDVRVYEDTAIVAGVPTDTTKVHIAIFGSLGENQSYKAATSTSSTDYLILTRIQLAVNRRQAASVDATLERRVLGSIFTPTTGRFTVNSTGLSTVSIELNPCLIVRPNSDIRIRASASTTGVEASATFSGYFAQISSP